MNLWDALHHIISPSFYLYIDGKHNESILNSAPIHNFKHPDAVGEIENCHIGNEAWLYKEENISMLLKLVYQTLTENYGYQIKPLDIDFLTKYYYLYGEDFFKENPVISYPQAVIETP
jgi:hypothetical protein